MPRAHLRGELTAVTADVEPLRVIRKVMTIEAGLRLIFRQRGRVTHPSPRAFSVFRAGRGGACVVERLEQTRLRHEAPFFLDEVRQSEQEVWYRDAQKIELCVEQIAVGERRGKAIRQP